MSQQQSRPRATRKTLVAVLVGSLVGSAVTLGAGAMAPRFSGAAPLQPSNADPGPAPIGQGGDPAVSSLSGGAMWFPWSPGPGELGANPQAFSLDQVDAQGRSTKRILASWTRNADAPDASLNNSRMASDDSGQIFEPDKALAPDFPMMAGTRLRDGSVLAADFVPKREASGLDEFRVTHSVDGARSWQEWKAPIHENLWDLSWYRIHRDLVELGDGTLLLGAYGYGTIDGVTKGYSLVLESADGGRNWQQRSLPNLGSGYSTNEMGFTRTSDGRLIAVLRPDKSQPNQLPERMLQTFSDDDGRSWLPLQPFQPPQGMPNNGIMPKPMLQPNGQLLLTYGRPDNNVVVSRDGTGRTWDAGVNLYARYPGENLNRRWMGSSGNMDIISRDASSSLAFGDTCHNLWFCREYSHDNAGWTKVVDAKGPGTGKLDLTNLVAAGKVKLTGALVPADPRFPEQRAQGAVDGSSEYRSAARFAGRAEAARGLTIELDREYELNRIGLMLGRGETGAARVQFSTDGVNWTRPVRTGERTDQAMRYQDFPPAPAKFVRVATDPGSTLSAITELELYSANTMTFENDAVGSIPRGVRDARYALVADRGDIPKYRDSRTRLALQDNDQNERAQATLVNPRPGAEQRMSFGYEGWGYGSGAIWEVLGKGADGKEVVVDRLLFSGDSPQNRNVVKQWDGSAWREIGAYSPFVPNLNWMDVALHTTERGTEISVNGTVLGTSSSRLAQAGQYTGLRVMTGERPQDVGNMEHSYDDIAWN